MLPIEVKIERAERLVRMLEEDVPLMNRRFAELTAEHRESASNYAAQITACARAELQRLQTERSQVGRPKRAAVGR